MTRLVAGLLLVVVGCHGSSTQGVACTPPTVTTYDCQPIVAGSAGCVGGPVWTPSKSSSPIDAAPRTEDLDKTFPAHCIATIPDCGCCYGGTGRQFECMGTTWLELL